MIAIDSSRLISTIHKQRASAPSLVPAGTGQAKFIGRRVGQPYDDIDPSAVYPGSINDAGRITFQNDSTVDTSMWGRFREGTMDYCVAPITLKGAGGGYYATGKNCCTADRGFYCIPDGTKVAGLVLAKDTEKYATALQSLELQDGPKFHGEGRGIATMVPIYPRRIFSGSLGFLGRAGKIGHASWYLFFVYVFCVCVSSLSLIFVYRVCMCG
eukprot:GEMP01055339.1.p1 GENE.GEMP01055339.1~~GEMP01055339.1.p1  ORF type:complete len:213 (+),score=29.88 GEMP01055339.1:305-943(+)